MSKKYLEAFNEIIDKFAEQIMRANKEELTAINKTNAIEYLYRTPQVRLLQQALTRLDNIDNANFGEALNKLKENTEMFDEIAKENDHTYKEDTVIDAYVYHANNIVIEQALTKAQENEEKLEVLMHLSFKNRRKIGEEYIQWCEKNKARVDDVTNMVTWLLCIRFRRLL